MTERPAAASDENGGSGSVRVVGTAHVSSESVDRVKRTIEEDEPDIVAVELDEGRYKQLQGEAPEDLDAGDLLQGNTVFQFLAYWMLSYVQARMGDRFDIEPGADMMAAIESGEAAGSRIELVDRDIQMTIQRFWARLSLPEKLKLVGGLAFGVTDPRMVGIALGTGIGLLFGAVFGAFVAPMVGLGELFAFGITSTTVHQLVGGLALGGGAGLLLGLIVLPAFGAALGPLGNDLVGGFVGLLAGATIGGLVGGGVLPAMGPVGIGTLGSTGETGLRLLGGGLAGGGFGAAVGALVGTGLNAAMDEEEYDEEFDIEDLTDGDVVTAMMEEFRRFSPGGAEALIDERDAYIAHHLVRLRDAGHEVVAVVGAGHREGIEQYLDHPAELPPMESITGTESGRRFSPYKIVGYLISLFVVVFFGLLALSGIGSRLLLTVLVAWFLFNGVLAFLMARLAGAHWTSAGAGGAVAWLTSINPLLAPGWFAGYVELRYQTVNVGDIATLNDLLSDEERPIDELLSEMLDVPLFRLIAIVAMTNVGSIIGTLLFPVAILPILGAEGYTVDEISNLLVEGAYNGIEILRGLIG